METYSVVLTFESVDEILWCDHSNETSSAVLLHGTICYSVFCKIKIGIFLMDFGTLGSLYVIDIFGRGLSHTINTTPLTFCK